MRADRGGGRPGRQQQRRRRAAGAGRRWRTGGEVVISRGELVEIGGGFRIPDVITQSGARLVEVGTTNKTRLARLRARRSRRDTKVLLKVHASNYRIIGFTSEASTGRTGRAGPRARACP